MHTKLSYDYIITGAGCAGLSLLYRLQQDSFFKGKKILVIDADNKKKNDRTWCFWEQQNGLFQKIVYKEWKQINFYSNLFSGRWNIAPYVYKMIRGSDFYEFVFNQLASWPNVSFLQASVEKVYSQEEMGCVQTSAGNFSATYVFNSILFQPERLKTEDSMLQHFTGWMIETEKACFDPAIATFMDFRTDTPEGNAFVYLLPITERKALIEYTVFSASLLQKEEYIAGLQKYIADYTAITNYTIIEEEFGVIPMSTYTFTTDRSSVINIGTAGGQTKGSSGYTFQFIQKQSAAIVELLLTGKHPANETSLFEKRFKLYDDVLLSVLYEKKLTAAQIFSDLFGHNKPQLIFKFLDNETTVAEELKIMTSVPSRIFMQAVWKQLIRK